MTIDSISFQPKVASRRLPPSASPAEPVLEADATFESRLPSRIAGVDQAQVEALRAEYEYLEQVPGELLVGLKELPSHTSLENLASEYGAKVLDNLDFGSSGSMLRLKMPVAIGTMEAAAAMLSDDRVSFAEPNVIYTAEELFGENSASEPTSSMTDNRDAPDDMDHRLWGLHNKGQTDGTPGADVGALEAWKTTKGDGGDSGPLIAVIDTGIDYNHPDLAANMWKNPNEIPGDGIDNDNNGVVDDVFGYNAADDHGDPMDRHSHGTHCAGTIGAVGHNGQGITGVMQDAKIMAVKILAGNNKSTTFSIARGIEYAKKMGADVTSNSWGTLGKSQAIRGAFEATPALHVVAAGNSSANNDNRGGPYPANFELDNILSVAATDHNDEKAEFSNYGKFKVDVSAPGKDIFSTVPGGEYDFMSGTSMAAPHVTGGAGLILSEFPDLTPTQVKDRLIYGSEQVSSLNNDSVSDGRVDFATSLSVDSVAPGEPNDFGVHSVTSRGANLTWTSVGDDKWGSGAAQRVEIRRSGNLITAESFDALEVETVGGAREVGELGNFGFTQAPTTTGETIHFAMRSVDEVGNKSDIRTTTVQIPAAVETFVHDFNDGKAEGFVATGDFQIHSWKGKGMVFGTKPPNNPGATLRSTLTTPEIDLSDKEGAYLRMKTRANLDGRGDGTTRGGGYLKISDDGGETWSQLHKYGLFQPWRAQEFDLTAYDGKKIRLQFEVVTYPGSRAKGFSVDDLQWLTEPDVSASN